MKQVNGPSLWDTAVAVMNLTEDQSDLSYAFFNGTSENNTSGQFHYFVSPTIDNAISAITVIILITTMISLGCTMEVDKIKAHVVRPKGVCIALVAQFGIMPLTAFCLGKIFQLRSIEAITVLICGCCPGGNLSNIFALALQGDMNLSIVMTTCSTLLALGAMPLLLYLYCKGVTGLEQAIPYLGIFVALIMTLVPCGVGIAINHWAPRYSRLITKIGLSFLLLATVAIGVLCVMTQGAMMWIVLSPKLISVAFLMPFTGYLLGYILSTIFRQNSQFRRTVAMETGCQNIQLCSTILKVAFPPEIIGPLYLFPLMYVSVQAGEALLCIIIFRLYQRCKPATEDIIKKRAYMLVDNGMGEKDPQEEHRLYDQNNQEE